MSPEAQRIAIGALMGRSPMRYGFSYYLPDWDDDGIPSMGWPCVDTARGQIRRLKEQGFLIKGADLKPYHSVKSLPDYHSSLDECREFEAFLDKDEVLASKYADLLLCAHHGNLFMTITAKPATKCECFLKALNKWSPSATSGEEE